MDDIPLVTLRMSDSRRGGPKVTSSLSPALPPTGSRSWASHFPSLIFSVFICKMGVPTCLVMPSKESLPYLIGIQKPMFLPDRPLTWTLLLLERASPL